MAGKEARLQFERSGAKHLRHPLLSPRENPFDESALLEHLEPPHNSSGKNGARYKNMPDYALINHRWHRVIPHPQHKSLKGLPEGSARFSGHPLAAVPLEEGKHPHPESRLVSLKPGKEGELHLDEAAPVPAAVRKRLHDADQARAGEVGARQSADHEALVRAKLGTIKKDGRIERGNEWWRHSANPEMAREMGAPANHDFWSEEEQAKNLKAAREVRSNPALYGPQNHPLTVHLPGDDGGSENPIPIYLGPVSPEHWLHRCLLAFGEAGHGSVAGPFARTAHNPATGEEATYDGGQWDAARFWYERVGPQFKQFLKDNEYLAEEHPMQFARAARGWMLTQVNQGPVGGLLDFFRLYEQRVFNTARSRRAGLNEGGIEDHLQGRKLERRHSANDPEGKAAGMAKKLSNFLGSSYLLHTRPDAGHHPDAGQSACIDVHAMRDLGFLTPKARRYIEGTLSFDEFLEDKNLAFKKKDTLPDGTVQKKWVHRRMSTERREQLNREWLALIANGRKVALPPGVETDAADQPNAKQYEYGVHFYNQVADWINTHPELGLGKDWTAWQAQALGWYAVQRAYGLHPDLTDNLFEGQSRHLTFELDFGTGVLADALGERWIHQADDPSLKAAQPSSPHLPSARITREVLGRALSDIARMTNTVPIKAYGRHGEWMGDTNPNLTIQVAGSHEGLRALGDALTYALGQWEVWSYRPSSEVGRDANALCFDISLPHHDWTPEERAGFMSHLRQVTASDSRYVPHGLHEALSGATYCEVPFSAEEVAAHPDHVARLAAEGRGKPVLRTIIQSATEGGRSLPMTHLSNLRRRAALHDALGKAVMKYAAANPHLNLGGSGRLDVHDYPVNLVRHGAGLPSGAGLNPGTETANENTGTLFDHGTQSEPGNAGAGSTGPGGVSGPGRESILVNSVLHERSPRVARELVHYAAGPFLDVLGSAVRKYAPGLAGQFESRRGELSRRIIETSGLPENDVRLAEPSHWHGYRSGFLPWPKDLDTAAKRRAFLDQHYDRYAPSIIGAHQLREARGESPDPRFEPGQSEVITPEPVVKREEKKEKPARKKAAQGDLFGEMSKSLDLGLIDAPEVVPLRKGVLNKALNLPLWTSLLRRPTPSGTGVPNQRGAIHYDRDQMGRRHREWGAHTASFSAPPEQAASPLPTPENNGHTIGVPGPESENPFPHHPDSAHQELIERHGLDSQLLGRLNRFAFQTKAHGSALQALDRGRQRLFATRAAHWVYFVAHHAPSLSKVTDLLRAGFGEDAARQARRVHYLLHDWWGRTVRAIAPRVDDLKDDSILPPGADANGVNVRRIERNPVLQGVARRYAKENAKLGIEPYEAHLTGGYAPYYKVDENLAREMADYHEKAERDPGHPDVIHSYGVLARELKAQYHALRRAGYEFVPWEQEGQPYQNSQEAYDDLMRNKKLSFFLTEGGFGSDESIQKHPLLAPSGVFLPSKQSPNGYRELCYNDLLCAVHDALGHGVYAYQFGPRGEENAWREHGRLFSREAQMALAVETRLQNSWVNFGPHLRRADGSIPQKGETGYVPPQMRPYAPQKVFALPEKYWDPLYQTEGHAPEMAKGALSSEHCGQESDTSMIKGLFGRSNTQSWIKPDGKTIHIPRGTEHMNYLLAHFPDEIRKFAPEYDGTVTGWQKNIISTGSPMVHEEPWSQFIANSGWIRHRDYGIKENGHSHYQVPDSKPETFARAQKHYETHSGRLSPNLTVYSNGEWVHFRPETSDWHRDFEEQRRAGLLRKAITSEDKPS